MTTVALDRPSFVGRLWGGLVATWGGFIGLLPHVLHHVGPLAGAALLAGMTGRVLFAAIGFVAATPFLRRLHRRFRTWKAPADRARGVRGRLLALVLRHRTRDRGRRRSGATGNRGRPCRAPLRLRL